MSITTLKPTDPAYSKIQEELRGYLNREPSSDEIINAQNDPVIMGRIRDAELAALQEITGGVTPN